MVGSADVPGSVVGAADSVAGALSDGSVDSDPGTQLPVSKPQISPSGPASVTSPPMIRQS